MDRVIVDGQEHQRAKQSCCQSKEDKSSSLEEKHGDGNSFTGPAGDRLSGVMGVNLTYQGASSSSTSNFINIYNGKVKEEKDIFFKAVI